ncbi:EAL domain-containing protein [Brucella cytisi]|nr:EAL domain-containing protein [Brucella cytisi]
MTAAILAVLASILPLIVLSEVDKSRTLERRKASAADYARMTALRVQQTLDDAKRALARARSITRTDCSREHMQAMERVAAESRGIAGVAYIRNGKIICTRLGVLTPPTPVYDAGVDLGLGYKLDHNRRPRLFQADPLIGIRYGDYGVLVEKGRFTDLIGQNNVIFGMATDQGTILELSAPAETGTIQIFLKGKDSGHSDRYVLKSYPVSGLIAFALIDGKGASANLTTDRRYILTISLAISLALIGIIIWISRLQLSPAKTLEKALRKRELTVHYQPIIELATGRCVGAEALTRWRKGNGKTVPPDQFIPLAEANGLIPLITDLVVSSVIADMATLLRHDKGLHISINIPASDIEKQGFLPELHAAVEKAGIDPSQIWLEVTERGFMNAPIARQTIEAARSAGFRVAIDDFGTGYSSLSLLEGLPLDALKIDKSFVDVIYRGVATSVVTPHIISMAHGLTLAMIAEGVETADQQAYLKEAGVQFGQGWFYSKALPPEQFHTFYSRRRAVSQSSERD